MTTTYQHRRWVDLTVELLTRPGPADPMIDLCVALSTEFGAPITGVVDVGNGRNTIAAFSSGPDTTPYLSRIVDHPLPMHYMQTHATTPATLQDVSIRCREPAAAAVLARARAEGMSEFLFVPLPRPAKHYSWLALAGDNPLRAAERQLCEDLTRLFLAVDAQSRALARAHPDRHPADPALSARELAVLALLADGLTAIAIAHRLGCSHRTIAKHQGNIYRKLEVHDRLAAVLVAQRIGILRATRAAQKSMGV